MKRLISILLLVLAIPAIAFSANMPNYEKDGELAATFTCDNGQTTVRIYTNEEKGWEAISIRPASGDVFVAFTSNDDYGSFYARLAETETMKIITYKEFSELLKEKSPAVYIELHGRGGDCKEQ